MLDFILAICQLRPADRGTCELVRNMWTYYAKTNECQMFPYNGCAGNANRFPTLEICEDICVIRT